MIVISIYVVVQLQRKMLKALEVRLMNEFGLHYLKCSFSNGVIIRTPFHT